MTVKLCRSDFADMSKSRILKWSDYPGFFRWVLNATTNILIFDGRWRFDTEKESVWQLKQYTMLLALKTGKGAMRQVAPGMQLWELEKAEEPILL